MLHEDSLTYEPSQPNKANKYGNMLILILDPGAPNQSIGNPQSYSWNDMEIQLLVLRIMTPILLS